MMKIHCHPLRPPTPSMKKIPAARGAPMICSNIHFTVTACAASEFLTPLCLSDDCKTMGWTTYITWTLFCTSLNGKHHASCQLPTPPGGLPWNEEEAPRGFARKRTLLRAVDEATAAYAKPTSKLVKNSCRWYHEPGKQPASKTPARQRITPL